LLWCFYIASSKDGSADSTLKQERSHFCITWMQPGP